MVLNQEQAKLLKDIMNDKFAAGPFSGMIYNAKVTTEKDTEELVRIALDVRLKLQELTQ